MKLTLSWRKTPLKRSAPFSVTSTTGPINQKEQFQHPQESPPTGTPGGYFDLSMNIDTSDKPISGKLDIPPDANNLRAEEMRRYFDTIFGDGSGWLHLAIGFKPYINANGKYQFRNFAPVSFPWPDPTLNAIY